MIASTGGARSELGSEGEDHASRSRHLEVVDVLGEVAGAGGARLDPAGAGVDPAVLGRAQVVAEDVQILDAHADLRARCRETLGERVRQLVGEREFGPAQVVARIDGVGDDAVVLAAVLVHQPLLLLHAGVGVVQGVLERRHQRAVAQRVAQMVGLVGDDEAARRLEDVAEGEPPELHGAADVDGPVRLWPADHRQRVGAVGGLQDVGRDVPAAADLVDGSGEDVGLVGVDDGGDPDAGPLSLVEGMEPAPAAEAPIRQPAQVIGPLLQVGGAQRQVPGEAGALHQARVGGELEAPRLERAQVLQLRAGEPVPGRGRHREKRVVGGLVEVDQLHAEAAVQQPGLDRQFDLGRALGLEFRVAQVLGCKVAADDAAARAPGALRVEGARLQAGGAQRRAAAAARSSSRRSRSRTRRRPRRRPPWDTPAGRSPRRRPSCRRRARPRSGRGGRRVRPAPGRRGPH